jgi:hypothetical protein
MLEALRVITRTSVSNFTDTVTRVERYFIVFLYCFVFINTVSSVLNGESQSHYAPVLDNAYIQSLQTRYLLSQKEWNVIQEGRFYHRRSARHVENKSKNEAALSFVV